VAIVGPNGAGKSTLVGMLTGQIAPDTGEVRLASGLEIALFDQARAALDPDLSLWQSLTSAEGLTVSGQADQVNVRGTPRHVMSYLKDFLFSEAQARAPVRSLSGGERARLLLARLMARQSNMLVLDEPTNDLDLETLDLLQELVADYPGTVLLVSHDRDFLDRTATLTVALEGEGRATVYAGGWSDMLSQGGGAFASADRNAPPAPKAAPAAGKAPSKTDAAPARRKAGLSFTERHRLEALPAEIDRLTAEMARLEELLSQPDLYTREPVKFAKASEALGVRQARLAEAEEEWLALAERAEAEGGT
jgi:ATP-binding cassette subfamily F protein uup